MSDFDLEAQESIAEGDDALQLTSHDLPALRAMLIATAVFWLIVAWSVWRAW